VNAKPALARALGFSAAASLAICNIVGQGIFLKTRAMTCEVGTTGLVLAAWVIAGVLALCGALTFAELGAMFPDSGGPYVYLRQAFGKHMAFAYGWMMFLLGAPLAAGALAVGGAIFLDLLSGQALSHVALPLAIGTWRGVLGGTQIAALIMLAVVAMVNLARVRTNGTIATVLAAVKIAMLLAVVFGAFLLGAGSFSHFAMSGAGGTCVGIASAARGGIVGFGAAMVSALYAYQGWTSVPFMAGEVMSPARTVPRALGASVIAVIVLYAAVNAAYFYVLPPGVVASVAASSSVGLEAMRHVFGARIEGVATALVLLSVLAALHVTILTTGRITYAVAVDTKALGWLSQLSGAQVPSRAILAGTLLAAVFVLLGSFDVLSDFEIFSVWIFYTLTAISLFALRRQEPQRPRPYRVWGYPLVPLAFAATAVWLLAEAAIAAPARSFTGLAVIALAFPVFALLRRREIVTS
jgi:APA family basic amino acid/polyamine antiporter